MARMGPLDFGSSGGNETTPTLTHAPVFTTSTTLGAASVGEGRIGWRWTLGASTREAEASFGRPALRIAVADDVERARRRPHRRRRSSS